MAIACSLTDNQNDNTSASTYTFSGMSLGTAAGDRHILVLINAGLTGTAPAISSVTVGGNAATSIIQATHSNLGFAIRSAIYIVAVSTGTTGNVVVTFASSMDRCAVALLRVTGLASATAYATAIDTADPCVASIDVPAGGLLCGTSCTALVSGTPACAWTNLTESYDTPITSTTTGTTGAFGTFVSAQTLLSVTADWSGGTNVIADMALASFSPAGDISVNLTGASAIGAIGALGKTISRTPTGVAGTSAIGTLAISALKILTGVAGTGAVGTITPRALISLLSVQGVAAVGALVADAAQRINLTGVQGTTAVGTVQAAVQLLLTGNGATGEVSQLAEEITLALIGAAAAMDVGDITVSDNWTRLGNAATTWSNIPAGSDIWTPVLRGSTTWTKQ